MKKIPKPVEVTEEEFSTLEALFDGWITRKDGVFVSSFLDSTLGWEEEIDIEEVPFVSSMVKTLGLEKYYTNKEIKTLKSFSFARFSLQSIGINTKLHKLKVSSKVTSYTDGHNIHVSNVPLNDERFGDTLNGMDVFVGLALHEGCHVLYTDFKMYRDFLTREDLLRNKLFKDVFNIIEDERIERRLLDIFPGNGNFIAKVKEYYFALMYEKIPVSEDPKNLSEFIGMFLQVIRFPRYLDVEVVEKYSYLLFKIKDRLTPYPVNMEDCLFATLGVLEEIIDFFEIKVDEDLKPEETSREGGLKGGTKKALERLLEEELSDFEEMKEDSGSEDVDEKGGGYGDEEDGGSKDYYEKILDGESHYGKHGLKVIADKSTIDKYYKLAEPLKKYIGGFRHFLFYNTNVRTRDLVGLKNGNLDTNKLVEGFQGVPTIYRQRLKETKERLTVALVVDMSGSMSGKFMDRARECAILMCEAFEPNRRADLYIYGYTGQELTREHAELYEFYTPTNKNKTRLVNLKARSQNLDGFSLLQTKDYIRKQTSNDVLLLMISDGQPHGSGYYGDSAIAHTKEAVRTLERDRFRIIHVAVGYEGLSGVYKNIIKVSDVSTLAKDLYVVSKRAMR